MLGQDPVPVAHLGIDEHRRGRARFAIDEQTGEYVLLADRWHTCFFGLGGQQGLLGQVPGRTADDAAYWLAQAPPAWRDRIEAVCIDLCSIYASAVRRMLPHATLTVDLFHVVQLAVRAVGDARRRVVRARYGRRGRSGDPEYGIKHLLVRNMEHLSPDQFTKIIATLDRDQYGQEIAAAWIAKEKLRDVLNLRARVTGSVPCEPDVRGRLLLFYDWCAQHDDIPELITLARTVSRWEAEIVAAVITGITNATSESLNRLAKLDENWPRTGDDEAGIAGRCRSRVRAVQVEDGPVKLGRESGEQSALAHRARPGKDDDRLFEQALRNDFDESARTQPAGSLHALQDATNGSL